MSGRPSSCSLSFSVGILTMPGEHDDTLELVDSILAIGDPGVRVFVHVNGGPAAPLREVLGGFGRVHVSASATNLGVATGRNLLIRSDRFMDADLALFLDNDLLISRDLFELYRNAFAALEAEHRVGIVGLPYYRYQSIESSTDEALAPAHGPLGTGALLVDRERVHAQLQATARALGTTVRPSNAGAIPDWRYAYLSPDVHIDRLANRLGMKEAGPAARYNQERPDFLTLQATREYVEASNVPGGSSCMRTSTIAELGMFDELYGPYGAEDIDHAIRILSAGRSNFVVLGGCLPHGTHERHRQRHTFGGALLEAINAARVRRLLCASHAPVDADHLALQIAIAAHLAEANRGLTLDAALLAALCGQRIAREQLDSGGPPRWRTTVSLDLVAMSPGRFGYEPSAGSTARHDAMTRLRMLDAAIAATSRDVNTNVPGPRFVKYVLDEIASVVDGLAGFEDAVLDRCVATVIGAGQRQGAGALTPEQQRQLRLLDRRVARLGISTANAVGRLVRKHPAPAAALRRILNR